MIRQTHYVHEATVRQLRRLVKTIQPRHHGRLTASKAPASHRPKSAKYGAVYAQKAFDGQQLVHDQGLHPAPDHIRRYPTKQSLFWSGPQKLRAMRLSLPGAKMGKHGKRPKIGVSAGLASAPSSKDRHMVLRQTQRSCSKNELCHATAQPQRIKVKAQHV
jgi:hypothetical protein